MSKIIYYAFDKKTDTIRPMDNVVEWARAFEEEDRHLGKDVVGDFLISTIFLGVDHSIGESLTGPQVFETMVFLLKDPEGGDDLGPMVYTERYATPNAARLKHKYIVDNLADVLAKDGYVPDGVYRFQSDD